MWRRWPWRRWRFKYWSNHYFAIFWCLARFFSLRPSGQHYFCTTVKKSQKLYELNEFYSVRRWRWIKVPFFKIQILEYFTCIFCRIKSLHSVIIVLPCMYRKIAAVLIYFFVNFWDTSKIRDIDDADSRDKLFQTQTGKNVSRRP